MLILEVHDVSKTFGGVSALTNVDFSVEAGSILGLIGPNGSGKTTLFNVIAGALRPTMGRVLFMGRDITGLPAYKVNAAGIGRTFQLSKTFRSMTVLEHVVAGRIFGGSDRAPTRKRAVEESEAILALTGMEDIAGSRVEALGVVDRKKVEVARALGTRPALLLLDEMMAGLNSKEIEETMLMVQNIRSSGVTVIMVEHVMKAVMGISDLVVVLNAGRKIAEGTPREVIENTEVIGAYLGEKYHS